MTLTKGKISESLLEKLNVNKCDAKNLVNLFKEREEVRRSFQSLKQKSVILIY